MRIFAIKNYERFQHYSERKPPWIKLYYDLLQDRDFYRLSVPNKYVLIGLFLIASRCENRIPDDPDWIAHQLGVAGKSIDWDALLASGFLVCVQDASPALAERLQDASASISVSVSVNSTKDWDPEDLWLKQFLEAEQTAFNGDRLPKLLDPIWWGNLSEAVNGLDVDFLRVEFAKMANWLRDNPGRGPTKNGVRRFIHRWLEKAANQRRRQNAPTYPN